MRLPATPFNINSTQQMSDILFKKLELPHEGLKKTKSGHFSTAANVLEGLKDSRHQRHHQRHSGIPRTGQAQKHLCRCPAGDGESENGRIHTSFNQTGAITGRIASSNPNLQNIPIRSEVGQQIRRGFVARPGWIFLAADYSQVELRVLAHICQDEALLEAFRQDQDIHSTTAAAVYSIPLEEVTYNQRRFAKAVNFGLIYGMGAFRLARDSELTLAEAENYIKEYFARFPGIQRYLDETKAKGQNRWLRGNAVGPAPLLPRFQDGQRRQQQAVGTAGRAGSDQPSHSGNGRRHHQNRHAAPARRTGRQLQSPHDPASPRRTAPGSAREANWPRSNR